VNKNNKNKDFEIETGIGLDEPVVRGREVEKTSCREK
jgi:hypothetical protein